MHLQPVKRQAPIGPEEDMTTKTSPLRQTTETCRWSAPACRPIVGPADEEAVERIWVCERSGIELPVTELRCSSCPHWEPDER